MGQAPQPLRAPREIDSVSAPRIQPAAPGPSTDIPDKLYFKIGEVSQLVGVEAHVLRYWEKEVASIRPGKSASNQRRYRRRDVELFREVKRLLHDEKYTLAGARKRLMVLAAELSPRPRKRGEELSLFANDPDLVQPDDEDASPDPTVSLLLADEFTPTLEANDVRLERLRAGLRELIRLAGGDVSPL